jgi:hypothetical protein
MDCLKIPALASPWHVHFASAEDENKDDATVAQQRQQENNPDTWKWYAALKKRKHKKCAYIIQRITQLA